MQFSFTRLRTFRRFAAAAFAAGLLLPQLAAADAKLGLGEEVFTQRAQPSCAVCHALGAAGASGQLGPDLDQLRPSAQAVRAAVRDGVGVMPAYDGLSQEELEALVHYVVTSAGQ